ncbi:uncharacterized protein UTRI_10353_B [Ustilago trichophora]|uniref:Wax synthase domain-containing protein n=1 Tax=Ustilago trichophora TaxID=86804 RepID=A0A5C3E9P4_9BASI|nr:uncharacterized protein UTRI_10353_B [Ustilago trichophora]
MSFQDKASTFFASLAGKETHSKLGFKLLPSDPVLDTARKFGYKVVEYDVPPYPLYTAGIIAVRMLSFIVGSAVVAYFLYHKVAVKSQLGKWFSILSLIISLLAWPLVTGRSGVMLLDFWRPALGFRSCLLVWDIFHIRSVQEVNTWSFARFFAQLWTFPKELDDIADRTAEEGYQRNARWENLKGMPKVAIEAIAMFGTLYFIPPFELTRNMSQLAYHCYCDALGLCILMALALFGDGLLKLLGILINVEMADMFENPLGTTNIRLFWSHWNRAIATVLHRVVFGGGKSKTQIRRKKAAAAAAAKKNFSHMDGLSETDAGHTSGEDEHAHSNAGRRRNASGLKPLSQVNNGDAELRKRGSNAKSPTNGNAASARNPTPAKKSSFLPKAAAAIVTFAMSGIFHEHITYFTLGFANGENFVFFLLNGVATVTATWFKRTYPEINNKIPTLVSVLMLHAFFLAVIPLFCSPFIRSGFFVQLEALRYELLPIRSRPRGSFIYLFGQ